MGALCGGMNFGCTYFKAGELWPIVSGGSCNDTLNGAVVCTGVTRRMVRNVFAIIARGPKSLQASVSKLHEDI